MSIIVESASVARARKRRKTAITLAVVTLVLAAAFYYASSYWTQGPSRAAGDPSCPTAVTTGALSPHNVTVNVYNATSRSGLAASTAKLVRERGFVLGSVSNDPAKKKVPQPAEVRFGPAGQAGAALVLALVPGAAPVKDTRADASVDLVLGDGYATLAPPTAPVPPPAGATAC